MADGLAFNVNKRYCDSVQKKLPRSLVNIMRSVDRTFDARLSNDTVFNGDNLTSWADSDNDDDGCEVKRSIDSHFRGDAFVSWTEDGVLPLNVALTTVEGHEDAHADIGWHVVTDRIVSWFGRAKEMDEQRDGTWKPRVFILLGEKAKRRSKLIDRESHVVLTACDPNDPSFNGSGGRDVFRKANLYLRELGHKSVRWSCRRRK